MKNFKQKQNLYKTRLIESAIASAPALLICCWMLMFAAEISAQTPGLWRGYNDEDWNNPTNWDNGTVPDHTVDVVITTSTVHYPILTKKLVVGSGFVAGNIYRCRSLEIQQWTRIDSEDSLWVNGNMTVAGLYLYSEQWLSGTHEINSGGTLTITSTGSVFIGQYGFPEEMKQDLVVNNGGTLINAGYFNVNDCLVIRAGGNFVMSGNEAYIMGWEGNYSSTFPGSFYVEAGASGGVSGGNFHVQGKEKPGFFAFHINEPGFDFTGTSLLHLHCNSDQEMPYPDFSSNTISGVECYDLTVDNLGSITTFYGKLKVNNDMNVESPSSVTISAGATVEVGHDFNLKTDITTAWDFYSSLIDYGQLIVGGMPQMQWALAGQQWHLVSSPVNGETADVFNGMYLQSFNETTNIWSDITSLNFVMQIMNGYAAWFDNYWNQSVYFTGTFNTGTLGYTGNLTKNNQGWNLVGNPYPSPIDWDASTGWTKTGVDNAIYSENDGNWATYINGVGTNGGSRYLSPCQGFFVRANANPATLGMNNEVRVHNKTLFLKEAGNKFIRLTASLAAKPATIADETVIRFDENSTVGFDGDYDAYKMFASDLNYPQIFTSDCDLSVNTLPCEMDVPLKFLAYNPGEYSVEITESEAVTQVFLSDLLIGKTIELISGSYEFYHDPTYPAERFVLSFKSALVPQLDENDDFSIRFHDGKIKICRVNDGFQIGSNDRILVFVFDQLGRIILTTAFSNNQTEVAMDAVKGIVLVKLVSGNFVQNQKVFIY